MNRGVDSWGYLLKPLAHRYLPTKGQENMKKLAPNADNLAGSKPRPALIIVWVLTFILTGCLFALGTWQVQRLFQKTALIERIEERAYGEPQALPTDWNAIGAPSDWEYSRITLYGEFDHSAEVQVYTVTDLGPGYWALTPLQMPDGRHVIINRGFVPNDMRSPQSRPEGQTHGAVTITGLIRATETGGLFLRENDLASQRYYRRDIAQIANAKGIDNAAPFYVDADGTANPGGLPIGGKTQLKFPNNHLSYAITWFILAVMMIAAGWFVSRNLNAPNSSKEEF
jgi:surfeit locus 1 family protein